MALRQDIVATEVVLPHAERYDVTSRHGRTYRIFVSVPPGPIPPQGRPVLYLLDGNATFPIAAVCTAMQSSRPESSGIGSAIVVGIGYPVDDYLDPDRRTYDYTVGVAASRPDGSALSPTGGADEFLDFVAGELMPFIQEQVGGDPARQAIFGHSFAGFLVLHALLVRPGCFRSYIASSPSIWLASSYLMERLGAFAWSGAPRRLLVTVGSDEQPLETDSGGTERSWRQMTRMVDNASDMAKAIAARTGGVDLSFKLFAGEGHASVLPGAISRAIRFALARELG